MDAIGVAIVWAFGAMLAVTTAIGLFAYLYTLVSLFV